MGRIFQELKRRNVIRVAIAYAVSAWLLIQVADALFPMLRLPEWTATFVAVLLLIGFPIALIFAWAFELTPEGIKLEKHVVRDDSITHLTGRKLDFTIIAMLVAALGYLSYDKFIVDPARDAELVQTTTEAATEQALDTQVSRGDDNSIAVLPFADLSPEGDQVYFSDGISEEILNVLANIPDLRVISRSSAFSFKGQNVDIPTVARKLGVANVLEGSVRKSGNNIRINAQLIDATTDTQLWSDSYDRQLEDVFAIQDEIAAAIVAALKNRLGLKVDAPPPVHSTASSAAHEAYLRGRYFSAQRTNSGWMRAAENFEQAIALDPEYAPAHAGMAVAVRAGGTDNQGSMTQTERILAALPHAERALDIDPNLAEAHAAMGNILYVQGDFDRAVMHLKKAIQINPAYVDSYTWLLFPLGALGNDAEALDVAEMALQVNPLSIPAIGNYASSLMNRHRLDEAERAIERFADIHQGYYAKYRAIFTSLHGQWANGVLGGLGALRIEPTNNVRALMPEYFAAVGLKGEALSIDRRPRPFVLSMLGEPDVGLSIAQEHIAAEPTRLDARHELGLALASAGKYASARPILEEMWKRSGGRVTYFGNFTAYSAAALVDVRRDAGEEESIDELLAAMNDEVRRFRDADIRTVGINELVLTYSDDFEEGIADYLAGNRERGLALIASAVNDGIFIPANEAYLQVLYDDPDFAPILDMQRVRQASERAKVLSVICDDNPYAEIWQPSEGTCDIHSEGVAN